MPKETRKQKAFLQHELMDRAFIIYDSFNTYIMDHPALEANTTLKAEAEALHEKLFAFYQKAGAR